MAISATGQGRIARNLVAPSRANDALVSGIRIRACVGFTAVTRAVHAIADGIECPHAMLTNWARDNSDAGDSWVSAFVGFAALALAAQTAAQSGIAQHLVGARGTGDALVQHIGILASVRLATFTLTVYAEAESVVVPGFMLGARVTSDGGPMWASVAAPIGLAALALAVGATLEGSPVRNLVRSDTAANT